MTPSEAVAKKEELTSIYSRLSEQLEQILEKKPTIWLELRKQAKSAAETDRLWQASKEGIEEMKLKMKSDRIEREISSLNSLLRVKEQEARHVW